MKTNNKDEMTAAEIDRYIHETILEKCGHDSFTRHMTPGTAPFDYECNDCGRHWDSELNRIPQYHSDASPRSLLNDVVGKVRVEMLGDALRCVIGITREGKNANCGLGAFATAEQISRACVNAQQSGGRGE